jgi:mono/diheme cytochrome c family protein
MTMVISRAFKPLSLLLLGLVILPGCTRDYTFSPVDMWNRSRLKPYEPIGFFDDQLSSRPLPAGVIARGELRNDDALFRGLQPDGRFVDVIPAAAIQGATPKEVIQRGQERYNIYCLPCHGLSGHGDGMIVRRGFSPPPDYRIARLRNAPVGHFYDVISNGYGTMYSYASRVPVNDRWAIAAYIRQLQKTQPEVVPDIRNSPEKLHALYGTQATNKVGTAVDSGSASQVSPGGGRPEPKGATQALPGAPVGTRSDGDPVVGVPRAGATQNGDPRLPSSGSRATQGSAATRGVPSNKAPRQPPSKFPSGQGGRIF